MIPVVAKAADIGTHTDVLFEKSERLEYISDLRTLC